MISSPPPLYNQQCTKILRSSTISPHHLQKLQTQNLKMLSSIQRYELHRLWGATGSLEDQSYLPLEAYNQSKVANVLFSIGLNIHLFAQYGIFSTSVHPGVIRTELGRHMGKETRDAVDMLKEKGYYEMKTMGQGVATGMVAALDPGLKEGVGEGREGMENWGAYMVDCQVSGRARGSSVESAQAERLWGLSEELVGERFGW